MRPVAPFEATADWETMEGAWAVEQRVWGGVACAVDVSSVVQSSSGISGVCRLMKS